MIKTKLMKLISEGKKALNGKTRYLLTVAAVLLLSVGIIGGTVAYLHSDTQAVENTFTAATPATPVIEETFDGETKEDVYVKLEGGDGSYFVRAAIVITLQDDEGNTVAQVPAADTDYTIEMGSGWTQDGNYWYYNSPVVAGSQTDNLIETCTSLSTEYNLVVDIIAQTIQAVPTTAAQTEWGYVPGSVSVD